MLHGAVRVVLSKPCLEGAQAIAKFIYFSHLYLFAVFFVPFVWAVLGVVAEPPPPPVWGDMPRKSEGNSAGKSCTCPASESGDIVSDNVLGGGVSQGAWCLLLSWVVPGVPLGPLGRPQI